MNVLSLFDGISCGQLALHRGGVKFEKYFASEIDKFAIKITQSNFPNTIQLGDCRNYQNWNLPKIDLIIGGSPCQDLSISKKDRQGLKGERSGLFYVYVQCLKKFKPKWFLLENVASMPKEAKNEISEILGVQPILINSALVSAQQRKRLYWTNIPNIQQPTDKKIYLKDILEFGSPCDVKNCGKELVNINSAKSQTLLARDYKGFGHQTMTGVLTHCVAQRGRINATGKYEQHLEIRTDGKTNALTTVHKDNLIAKPIRVGQIGQGGQGQRIYSIKGKSVSLNANGGGQGAKTGLYKIDLPDGDYIVRKLTPVESERLQTLPDNYTACVSNSQRYKSIGNGWTVDVIAHILKNIPIRIKELKK